MTFESHSQGHVRGEAAILTGGTAVDGMTVHESEIKSPPRSPPFDRAKHPPWALSWTGMQDWLSSPRGPAL
jgi:hypothetical protein